MQISAETRAVLRHYRQIINARRREDGMKALSTPQIVDEICEFMLSQQCIWVGSSSCRRPEQDSRLCSWLFNRPLCFRHHMVRRV